MKFKFNKSNLLSFIFLSICLLASAHFYIQGSNVMTLTQNRFLQIGQLNKPSTAVGFETRRVGNIELSGIFCNSITDWTQIKFYSNGIFDYFSKNSKTKAYSGKYNIDGDGYVRLEDKNKLSKGFRVKILNVSRTINEKKFSVGLLETSVGLFSKSFCYNGDANVK